MTLWFGSEAVTRTSLDGASGAVFDPTYAFRYHLWRVWDETKPRACFLLLNPSTADEFVLDPTLRRCEGYSKAWGYGGMNILNLFAFRATDPDALKKTDDPVGPENDAFIVRIATQAPIILCGWGSHPFAKSRILAVKNQLAGTKLSCLKKTQTGEPCHPLYLKKTLVPMPLVSPVKAPKPLKIVFAGKDTP